MILQIRLNLDIFTVWKKLKSSIVKSKINFRLLVSLKARGYLNSHLRYFMGFNNCYILL